MEKRKSHLSRGKRVGVGLGCWAVGIGGLAGGAAFLGMTPVTKAQILDAAWDGDKTRQAELTNRLHTQQIGMGACLLAGGALIGAGAACMRGTSELWSGPVYGQDTSGSAPPPTDIPPLDLNNAPTRLTFPDRRAA